MSGELIKLNSLCMKQGSFTVHRVVSVDLEYEDGSTYTVPIDNLISDMKTNCLQSISNEDFRLEIVKLDDNECLGIKGKLVEGIFKDVSGDFILVKDYLDIVVNVKKDDYVFCYKRNQESTYVDSISEKDIADDILSYMFIKHDTYTREDMSEVIRLLSRVLNGSTYSQPPNVILNDYRSLLL